VGAAARQAAGPSDVVVISGDREPLSSHMTASMFRSKIDALRADGIEATVLSRYSALAADNHSQ